MRSTALILTAAALALSACATRPKGPTIYDSVVLEFKTDTAILIPPNLPKEVVENMKARVAALTKTEVAEQGDLAVVTACGEKTARLVQDISSVQLNYSTIATPGLISSSSKTEREAIVSITTEVIDCTSGKSLGQINSRETDSDVVGVLTSLVSDSVKLAYARRHAR